MESGMESYNMSNFNIASESQESENEILLPVNNLYPPNEIISKKYAPDSKPTFKLIAQDKKERRRVTIPSEPPPSFFDFFAECDTLGYEYASLLRNKLIYLKYNNSAYMKLATGGKAIKYLGGMFIPLERLLSESLRKAKNVFKTLPNLEYTDNEQALNHSFGNNYCLNANNLRFSSNYEGSNLFAVVKVAVNEYDLILQNDTNSKGNTQWFNFAVEMLEEGTYKFNIVNLTKATSLYQKGMKVVYFSQNAKLNHGVGWTRGCHNITYTPTSVLREDNDYKSYYCLHFEFKSSHKNDVVTFAYSFPYSLIDLDKFFNRILMKRPTGSLKIERVKVAETLSGFPLNAYAFTQKKYQKKKPMYSTQTVLESKEVGPPSVIFLARQHPGESQGSYVAEGVAQWLLEGDYDYWKKSFHFYVVPMVNMDGVFYGNYRTNLSGNDLNRIWRHPRRDYHCEIHALKKFLYALNKTNPIALIVDIHGHSNSLNSFFYGNPPPRKDSENPRLFPYYCSRKVKQISYTQSTFTVSEDKKASARVVLSEMFPKALVYTFENSFYGWRRGKTVVEHTIDSYRRLGKDLVQSFVEYSRLSEKNPSIKERWSKEIEEVNKETKETDEQVVSESDEDVADDLVEFEEMKVSLSDAANTAISVRNGDKKKSMPNIGKNQFVRYMRRHSPLKLRSYCTANETYVMDKTEPAHQSQGFLSIVKINTKTYLDSAQTEHRLKICLSRDEKREPSPDCVVEEMGRSSGGGSALAMSASPVSASSVSPGEGNRQSQKQNESHDRKVNRLISQKEMIMQKMRDNRRKLQEGMIHNRSSNGFFRYNYIKKS